MKRVQIAVRDFAVPVPRKGHIEVHSGYGYLPQSGDEVHRQVQAQRSASNAKYKTEVRLSHSFEHEDYVFVVSGRIDGLIESEPPYLEEIKTAFDARALYEKLQAEPDHPYCLQLLTYAYIYGLQNACTPASSFLIASYADGKTFELPLFLDLPGYERWLEKRLDELVVEAKYREQEKERRVAVGKALRFPFTEPRRGQQDLIDTIERAFASGESLLLQAPTGMGKTAGVIFPSLKDALERGQKLIYVTPKNSQHQVAEDAISLMRGALSAPAPQKKRRRTTAAKIEPTDQPLRSLTLTAKAKVCFKGEPVCNPEHCEFARDYYGKVYEHKLVEKAAESQHMNADVFAELGEKYEVCPFELSVDSIQNADIIIGDYNYAFSPQSLIGRFTGYGAGENQKPNIVIDEAHNLPARACDYFSPSLSTAALDGCRERVAAMPLELRVQADNLVRACFALITRFQPKGRQRQCKIEPPHEPFVALSQQLSGFLNQYLQVVSTPKPGDPIVSLCRQWSEFTDALEFAGEQFFSTFSVDTYGVELRITCCDASEHLASCLKEFEHVVAFSATLKPFDYYRQLCGFMPDNFKAVEFTSPFPKDNRKVIVIPQVSTKYSDRAANYSKISEAIKRIVELRPGNYFVFFPSFAFLREVHDRTKLEHFEVLQQQPGMSAADVQKFIDKLRGGQQPTVIFAVQGGVFSEGVDYPGDMLIGALIVGPALPGFDLERELMREYYEKKFGQGFDYAYTYPAMARVVQAAGRVIRSERDRGLIVLMDRRFTSPTYAATMPGDWYSQSVTELVSGSILHDVRKFWTSEEAT